MNPSDEVKEYIRSHLEQGFSPQEITNQLKNAGWHDDHIQPALQWALASHVRPAPGLNDLPSASTIPSQPALNHSYRSKRQLMRVPIMSGIIAAVILVCFGALVLYVRGGQESPQKTFETAIVKAMQTGTFKQKMTDSSDSSGTILLETQNDYRDPKTPKIAGTVSMKYDLDTQASVKGTLTIKQDIVAIKDTVYLKTTDFTVDNVSSEVEKQLLALRKTPTDTVEDVLMNSFGVSSLNTWKSYDTSKLNEFIAASGGDFNAVLASAVSASNTVLGEYIIGNLGAQASASAQKLLASGMYTVDYEAAKSEKEGSVTYTTYVLDINQDKAKSYQNALITTLGLSEREKDITNIKDTLPSDTYTLWINPKTHYPYKVVTSTNENFKIEYSDFGANYTITAPL